METKRNANKKKIHYLMETLEKKIKAAAEFTDKLYYLLGSSASEAVIENSLSGFAIEAISVAMEDSFEWLNYFIYDLHFNFNDFKVYIDEEEKQIKDYSDLYDLMKKQKEEI